MNIAGKKLRYLILESPYDTLESNRTLDLFGKVVRVKILGYRNHYDPGILPTDQTDYVSSHSVICEDSPEGLRPILAYRSISLWRCEFHGIQFPLLRLLRENNFLDHAKAVESIIDESRQNDVNLRYDSCVTYLPELRTDLEFRKHVKHLLLGMQFFYHQYTGSKRVLTGGVTKYKMDHLFRLMGWDNLEHSGTKLGPVTLGNYVNTETLFMDAKMPFTTRAKEIYDLYGSLWANAEIICDKKQMQNLNCDSNPARLAA